MNEIDTLVAKILEKKMVPKKGDPNLCECELYSSGDDGLVVTLWHPKCGSVTFSPSHPTIAKAAGGADGRLTAFEVHSTKKVVGCILNYYTLDEIKQGEVTVRIQKAWNYTPKPS